MEIRKKYIKDGYVYLVFDNGYKQAEHRYVMEQHLGVKLASYEVVHHKNRNPQDNRIENLEVMTAKDHIVMHGREYREELDYAQADALERSEWDYVP